MSETTITLKDKGLDELVKAFKDNSFKVKIGVIDSGTQQGEDSDGKTNAEIGVLHEFGTSKLPVRSWLRMPLTEKLNKAMKKAGAFDKEAIKKIIESKSIEGFLKTVGLVGESVIMDAFNTGGFGVWTPSNMKGKENQQTLVETGQLRNSVSSEVIRDD